MDRIRYVAQARLFMEYCQLRVQYIVGSRAENSIRSAVAPCPTKTNFTQTKKIIIHMLKGTVSRDFLFLFFKT